MNYFLVKFQVAILAIVATIFPIGAFAQAVGRDCSYTGYTIMTINGVFTDDIGARKNRNALKEHFGDTYNNEPLTVDFLLNPSHLGGLGDIAMAAYQKIFDEGTVNDYDLTEMIKTASKNVRTQKLLLVAHSQGNFYANSFYDTVTVKIGEVPIESIGVYGIATPSDRVAGGGLYLTSKTDLIISGIVGRVPLRNIKTPNTDIREVSGNSYILKPFATHFFSDVYLKYRGNEVVEGIQTSLNKLTTNTQQDPNKPCIDPPKLTVVHKITGVVLAVADPATKLAMIVVVTPVVSVAKNMIVTPVVEMYHIAVGVSGSIAYTAVAAGNTVKNIGVTVGAKVFSLVKILNDNGGSLSSTNQGASVLLAIQKTEPAQATVVSKEATTKNIRPVFVVRTINKIPSPVIDVRTTVPSENPPHSEMPRLVFIGNLLPGFGDSSGEVSGGGGTSVTQVLGTSVATTNRISESTGAALTAPVLLIPQCASSLATSGCLLATTTVRFEWGAVAGADHYAISKNGEYATTTEITLDIVARDFSDYTLGVMAVFIGDTATTSATSTKKVSIATIPIAINEVAWMGTRAASNDEWIELKNNTDHTIDLSQWALESKDEKPYIKLSGTIKPREYIVLERTSSTATNVAEHAIYVGALNNTGDQLTLLYASTTLDRTPDGAWVAGENTSSTTRKTMERHSSKVSGTNASNWATWGTNIDFIKNGLDAASNAINGTPGARNSVSYLINKGENISSNFTLTADEDYYIVATSTTVTASSTLSVEPGVIIKFYQTDGGPSPELNISGILHALGTKEDPITLESLLKNQTGRIRFIQDSGTSTISHMKIESINGIYLVNNARLEISNTQFLNNFRGLELRDGGRVFQNGSFVRIGKGSSVTIENTNFASTTKEAIAAYNGSSVSVASSTITNSLQSEAIGIYDGSLFLESTTIDSVKDGSGIYTSNSVVSIASSTISNISKGNGLSLDNSTSTIANTAVKNTRYVGISINGGNATIASSTVSDIADSGGISVSQATILIASSTIRNVLDGDGISLINSTSTIINTVIENTATSEFGDGIRISGGTVTVTESSVSGFTEGSGISVKNITAPVIITSTDVLGNGVGIEANPASSVVVVP